VDQARESYRTIVEKLPKHEKAKLAATRWKELGGSRSERIGPK
jgi:hypothetical protein